MITVALIGASGAGKSKIGRLLAARLGVPIIDVDAEIEAASGREIREIFDTDGEAAFRALERDATLAALARPGVVSLGGGAPMTPAIADALRDMPHVVWLRVSPEVAASRIGSDPRRPLLRDNALKKLMAMIASRTPTYASVCSHVVDADLDDLEGKVDLIVSLIEAVEANPLRTIRVAAERPYDVTVGHGAAAGLPDAVKDCDRIAVIHPAVLTERVADWTAGVRGEVVCIEVPDGEAQKTAAVVERCWGVLADAGFTRSDAVVGVGGGATTDLAGFVAATWMRGVQYVSVPTTVLGMVDAAVGGKTGINVPQGKNLVGAFWEPAAVLADLDALATLPVEELRGGLAEVIKHGFIADPRTLELFESEPSALLDPTSPALAEAIERSIAVKASIVGADLREATSVGKSVGRELLNYGHTLAHAIERRERYAWRHGDAVAVGLVYAATLSRNLGNLDAETAERHRRILASVGLPVTYDAGAWDELRATMSLDKKARGSSVRFVLLDGVADPFIAVAPDEDVLRASYDEIAK